MVSESLFVGTEDRKKVLDEGFQTIDNLHPPNIDPPLKTRSVLYVPPPMSCTPSTLPNQDAMEIARLRKQLEEAEERLELAQSLVFNLRCTAARKEGRGLWMRDNDKSGLREAVWKEKQDLGAWVLLKVSCFFVRSFFPICTLMCVSHSRVIGGRCSRTHSLL